MSSKVFSYSEGGLSYTVSVYEKDGKLFADITVDEGAMDVNAVYFGDDTFSGDSAGLKGPQNMNGAGSQLDGETVQWDSAVAVSKPGLGREGTDKESYLSEGDEPLTVCLGAGSLEDVDVLGIRATSTTTESGSIKGVSKEEPEEPVDPEEPEEPTFDKVFFGDFDGSGTYIGTEPNGYDAPVLPGDQEPTLENYLSYFESDEVGGDVSSIEVVTFYECVEDDDGNLVLDGEGNPIPEALFSIEAPEGGFRDAEHVLELYDQKLDEMEDLDADTVEGMSLMAMLSLPEDDQDDEDAIEEDAEDAELA